MISADLLQKAYDTIVECYEIAKQKWGKELPLPSWELKRMGHCAGKAYFQRNHIALNPDLWGEYPITFIERTVRHEAGHLIAGQLYKEKGHGPMWRYVCRELGMTDVTRCHSYDTTNARLRIHSRKNLYCACDSPITVTKTIYNKVIKAEMGVPGYPHRRCVKCKTRVSSQPKV